MEVAGLAVWGVALRRTKLTDEQVPLSLSTPASAPPLEQGTIGPNTELEDRPIRVILIVVVMIFLLVRII